VNRLTKIAVLCYLQQQQKCAHNNIHLSSLVNHNCHTSSKNSNATYWFFTYPADYFNISKFGPYKNLLALMATQITLTKAEITRQQNNKHCRKKKPKNYNQKIPN